MKTLLVSLLSLLVAEAAALASIDLGSHSSYTPYDRYISPVKQVLNSLPGEQASMRRAEELMRVGRAFRYSYTDPYVAALPAVTSTTKAGDCKAKSLWICDQLGDENVRYVIGKATRKSRISHAWIMWQHQGRWWILDCTNTSRPIPADRVGRDAYIPLYSYDKSGSYRHSATQMFANQVATRKSPVAAGSARR